MNKRIIYILIMIIIGANFGFAQTQNAQVEYSTMYFEKNPIVSKKHLKSADVSYTLFQKNQTPEGKKYYLDKALKDYYLASKFDNTSIDSEIGLGRVYDSFLLDKMAKEHFSNAINMGTFNPRPNFYFGDYYFKRNDFLNALFYYKIAYEHGYAKNFELNLKLAMIYEKLADIKKAEEFYTKALKLKPNYENINEKIRMLDELNYDDSQYYLFIK